MSLLLIPSTRLACILYDVYPFYSDDAHLGGRDKVHLLTFFHVFNIYLTQINLVQQ